MLAQTAISLHHMCLTHRMAGKERGLSAALPDTRREEENTRQQIQNGLPFPSYPRIFCLLHPLNAPPATPAVSFTTLTEAPTLDPNLNTEHR